MKNCYDFVAQYYKKKLNIDISIPKSYKEFIELRKKFKKIDKPTKDNIIYFKYEKHVGVMLDNKRFIHFDRKLQKKFLDSIDFYFKDSYEIYEWNG